AGREAAGASIGAVAVLADDAADERTRLIRDVPAPVEDAGDGRDRDAGAIGDLPDRDAVGGHGHRPIEACSGTFRKSVSPSTTGRGLTPPFAVCNCSGNVFGLY